MMSFIGYEDHGSVGSSGRYATSSTAIQRAEEGEANGTGLGLTPWQSSWSARHMLTAGAVIC